MKPPPFEYFAPTSLDEALTLRSQYAGDSALLAGGQSLMPMLNLRLARPGVLIDLGHVPELAGIRESDGGVAIGAMTRQREAERSELLGERAPLVGRALRHVGHPTIRNRGTVGGSITHADPAAELPAVALALDGEFVVRSIRGERTIAANDFFVGVFTTALEPDELLVDLRLPDGRPGGSAFVEVTRRHGDFALVGVAAVLERDGDGPIANARIAFIGVGGTAVRAPEAEELLRGADSGDEAFVEAAERAAEGLDPQTDLHASGSYRRRVAGALARRALQEASA
jgi:aerobic carbon-monoxide dehydrogenase medium subunit